MCVKNRISTNDFSTTRPNHTKSSHIPPVYRLRSKKKHTIIIQLIRRGKGGVPKICQTAKRAWLFLARTAQPDIQIWPFLCQSTQAGPKGRAVSRTTLRIDVGGELHHPQVCASPLCQTAKCAWLFLARTAQPDIQIWPFLCQSTQAGPKGRAVSRTTLRIDVGGELHHPKVCASLLCCLGLNLDLKNGWQLIYMTKKRWWTSWWLYIQVTLWSVTAQSAKNWSRLFKLKISLSVAGGLAGIFSNLCAGKACFSLMYQVYTKF